MSSKTISQLTSATELTDSTITHVRQDNTDKKATLATLASFLLQQSVYGFNVETITLDTSITTITHQRKMYLVNTDYKALTVYLPYLGGGANAGTLLYFLNIGSFDLTLIYKSGVSITIPAGDYASLILLSSSTGWYVMEESAKHLFTKYTQYGNNNGPKIMGSGDLITLKDNAESGYISLALKNLTASGVINESKGGSLASASTVNIGDATGNLVEITGTTTINSFGAGTAGMERTLYFSGNLTITYNAAAISLPGNVNLAMKAGEAATFRCLDGTVWICTNVSKNSTTDNHGKQFFVTSGVFTVPEGVSTVQVTMCGGGGGSGSSGYEGGSGGGGGAAGAFKEIVTNLISGSEITVTVGAGGAGGTAVEENGHDGGASSFGSYLTRSGGKGSGYGWTVYPGLGGASGGGIYCTAGSNGTKTDGGKGGSSLIDYLTTNIGGGGYNNLFYYLMAKCFWTYTYGTGANGRIGLKSDNNSAGEGNPGYSGFVLVEW